MKHLSLTSLLGGTLIVLAPIGHNFLLLAMLTHLLAIDPHQNFNLHGMLAESYQGWCLFVGVSLLVVGVVSGFRSADPCPAPTPAFPGPAPVLPARQEAWVSACRREYCSM